MKKKKVEVNIFKSSGKWYDSFIIDMSAYYDILFIHDACKKAIEENSRWMTIDGSERDIDSWYAIILNPFHKDSHPVTIWLK